MTGKNEGQKPAHSTQFQAGVSGNYKGRPKDNAAADRPDASASAFGIIINRTFEVTQNGQQHELTAEEALQWRTYQDAIKGDKLAQREVLRMIAKREKWRTKNEKAVRRKIEFLSETDPDNADEAMLILDVAAIDQERQRQSSRTRKYLLLELWAVQAALSRRSGGRKLDDQEIEEIKRCMRDPTALRWPRGSGE